MVTDTSVTYVSVAYQVRQAGDLLHLPYQPIATALAFVHRFKQARKEAYPDTVSSCCELLYCCET